MCRTALPLLCCILLANCGGDTAVKPQRAPQPVDMSGHWEMDYGRSDNVNEILNRMYREWRQARQRETERARRGNQGPFLSVEGPGRGFDNIVDAARLADMITESQVLEIEQSEGEIEIGRENSFALTCLFDRGEPETVVDELGSEICGWDGRQLVFRMRLPDGLDIRHRVTMSPDGYRLHIATTVDSSSAPPFTLDRFYFRFEPLRDSFECEYTLSRGNVCELGGTGS